MPDASDFVVVLNSRIEDFQAQLLETNATSAVIGEIAVSHCVNRVCGEYVRVQHAQAVLQIVDNLNAVQRMTRKINLQCCKTNKKYKQSSFFYKKNVN